MKLSTRYGLVGIGALALLSLVHWLRDAEIFRGPTNDYLLGILPNFAAAIAIAFVLLSIWADQNRDAKFEAAMRPFLVCASISAFGLLAWELFQKTSNRFVFDTHDIGATMIGIGMATLLFYTLTPRQAENCCGGVMERRLIPPKWFDATFISSEVAVSFTGRAGLGMLVR